MDTIGEEEKFYGYVIGLQVERHPEPKPVGTRLYATFEYNGEVSVWEVPDPKLFEILSGHLCSMAITRSDLGEYGYDKVWIEKRDGKWLVDLP